MEMKLRNVARFHFLAVKIPALKSADRKEEHCQIKRADFATRDESSCVIFAEMQLTCNLVNCLC